MKKKPNLNKVTVVKCVHCDYLAVKTSIALHDNFCPSCGNNFFDINKTKPFIMKY
jgi:Zn finger protein HypA/HybF involved in hydrogenase expression